MSKRAETSSGILKNKLKRMPRIAAFALIGAFAAGTNSKAELPAAKNSKSPPQSQATKAVTRSTVLLARDVLTAYNKAPRKNKQRREIKGSSTFAIVSSSEITVEYIAKSNITQRRGEYILQASFKQNRSNHTRAIKPSNVISLGIRETSKLINPPVWKNDRGVIDTYHIKLNKTNRRPLQENTSPMHWDLDLLYFKGSGRLTDSSRFDSAIWTTGPETPFLKPLPQNTMPAAYNQAKSIIAKAVNHVPISLEQSIIPDQVP